MVALATGCALGGCGGSALSEPLSKATYERRFHAIVDDAAAANVRAQKSANLGTADEPWTSEDRGFGLFELHLPPRPAR